MRPATDSISSLAAAELASLFQRLEVNADTFGMPSSELEMIKKECTTAYKHKLLLDKILSRKRG